MIVFFIICLILHHHEDMAFYIFFNNDIYHYLGTFLYKDKIQMNYCQRTIYNTAISTRNSGIALFENAHSVRFSQCPALVVKNTKHQIKGTA